MGTAAEVNSLLSALSAPSKLTDKAVDALAGALCLQVAESPGEASDELVGRRGQVQRAGAHRCPLGKATSQGREHDLIRGHWRDVRGRVRLPV